MPHQLAWEVAAKYSACTYRLLQARGLNKYLREGRLTKTGELKVTLKLGAYEEAIAALRNSVALSTLLQRTIPGLQYWRV